MTELYLKHRPTKLSSLLGQDTAVGALNQLLTTDQFPHCLLLSGPSGVGKTTIARILKTELGCGDRDYMEINAAKERGIDITRDVTSKMYLAPLSGKCRIYVLDEMHQQTSMAQESLLKALEDTPKHVYFILCTTDPSKLKRTILTRSTRIKLNDLSDSAIHELVNYVSLLEKKKLAKEVADEVVSASDGSARQALVLLNQVLWVENPEDARNFIRPENAKGLAIDLVRAMVKGARWVEVARILDTCEADPEQVRQLCLNYASKVMLGKSTKKAKAYQILNAFRDNFYDSKKAGLIAACYEVVDGIPI